MLGSAREQIFGHEIIFEEFQPMWSRYPNVTDGQTDGRTIYDRNTALCTKVHRAVKRTLAILQRVSIACCAKRCTNYRKHNIASVRPSVRPSHAGTVSKRLKLRSWGLHCRHLAVLRSYIVRPSVCPSVLPHDSSFLTVDFSAKFQREPRERGRQMREG